MGTEIPTIMVSENDDQEPGTFSVLKAKARKTEHSADEVEVLFEGESGHADTLFGWAIACMTAVKDHVLLLFNPGDERKFPDRTNEIDL